MVTHNNLTHASNSEPIAHEEPATLNPSTPRGKLAKRDDTGALEIRDSAGKSVLEYLNFFTGEGIKGLLRTSGIMSDGFKLLQDVAKSLPTPTLISTHKLGKDMKDLNPTQNSLAYFLQTTSGISNEVFYHAGAVGCDVDDSELLKVQTINFRLAKNKGLCEKDLKFMKILQDLMNGHDVLAHVEPLALKHVTVRILHDVRIECQGLQTILRRLAPHGVAGQAFGKDSLEVLDWLANVQKAKELHRSDKQRKARPLNCVLETADQFTEEAIPRADHLVTNDLNPGLYETSQALRRLWNNRESKQVEDEIREFLELTGSRRTFLDLKTKKLSQCFYSILKIIADPLLNLDIISGFLPKYRCKHILRKINIKLRPLAAPCSPVVPTIQGPMLRLKHCEMQVLDYYLLRKRPEDEARAITSRIDLFKQHLNGFTGVLKVWQELSEAELECQKTKWATGRSKPGKSLAR
ncbi:hypothetical protein BDP81DRAFT_516278 [Colletotrichum phormii]|uniref:Uncharacterized protein n=1 Tax=Colletotrichum phormii TaxID=359342 RepID=A0AAI9ZV59_9PEZI|nr:uncharacterized protein BDP81DRAFT_516278 [Colletotrichum phormii]KAK1638451.1 hypothetical protein BDP81DRAFT_516278 [Colletotrichum phormii]